MAVIAPFMLAFGISVYFALPSEPFIAYPFIISVLIAGIIIRIFLMREKLKPYNYIAAMFALFILLGFFYSAAWTHAVGTEMISRPWRDAVVQGDVSKIDYSSGRAKVWMKNATTNKDTPPMTMRITLPLDAALPDIGDTISVKAALWKPEPPDAPGAFDFAKWSYFNGIGANGYATEEHQLIARGGTTGAREFFSRLRNKIHTNIAANASATATMLADSLVLGHSRAMSRAEADNIRASGLAHVFTISGLHMTLIGGWFFIIWNFLFRLFPRTNDWISSARLAVLPTWMCLAMYLAISGAGVATIRAFIMASIGFLALVAQRQVVSLRILGLCAFALLILRPHYALEAGFQMSFAAVFGLIYFLGGTHEYVKRTKRQRIARAMWFIILTSIISTIFTMPFLAHHFHAIAIYGELGNLFCLTIFSVAILPLVLFGTIAAAAGYFGILELAAQVFQFTYGIIEYIAAMPHSLVYVPSIPGFALGAIVFGGMFILLAQGRARYLGWIPIALSVIYVFAKPAPVMYVSRDREVIALMTDDGHLRFNMPRSKDNPFVFESWAGLNAEPFPERQMRRAFGKGFVGKKFSLECSDGVCIYKTKNWNAGIALRFVGLVKNLDYLCENADFIIAADRVDYEKCSARIINEYRSFVVYPDGEIKFVDADRLWHRK